MPSEVAKLFGSECWVKEAEVRRQGGKKEPPNKHAIYLGPSRDVKHGVKVAFIDYNEKKQVWIISKTEHRALKNVSIINGSMVLKTKPHKEVPSAELEKHLDKTATKGAIAEVYEIYKIHDKRYVGGKAEYKCSWKGYNKNHKTWEPAQNLLRTYMSMAQAKRWWSTRSHIQGALKGATDM